MKFTNLEKYLDEFAKDVEDDYIQYLSNQNYQIAKTITTRVDLMGNSYTVYMNLAEYWKYIEYGRRPGKRPPINSILKWVRNKGITPRGGIKMSQRSLAYVIAKKIGEFGIKPRPVLFEKIIKSKNFETNVLNAFKKDIKEDLDSIKNWNNV